MTDGAGFPESRVVLTASRAKEVKSLLVSMLFVVVGLLARPAGWALVGFFSLISGVSVLLLIFRGRLEMDREGIHVVHFRRRWPTLEWRYCKGFRPYPGGRIARATMAMSGANASLPNTYGRSARGLCELLETEQARALGQGSAGSSG